MTSRDFVLSAVMSMIFSTVGLAACEGVELAAAEFPLAEALGDGAERVDLRRHGDRSDRWVTGNYPSSLSVTLPSSGNAPTAAVVICPGGGYAGLAYDKEGVFIAEWMNDRGVAAGVLKYRTGGGAHQHPAPRDDVQFALQTMRASATRFGYPADKVGVMGFSAGGHLAATATTQFKNPRPNQNASTPPAACSSRPDFAVLVYAVISMEADVTHGGSRRNLLGDSPSDELVRQMSAERNVTRETPPTFIVHAADDAAVSLQNPLQFYGACLDHKVPVEMHLFEQGGHGFGMWREGLPVETWPDLLEAWMRQQGLIAE